MHLTTARGQDPLKGTAGTRNYGDGEAGDLKAPYRARNRATHRQGGGRWEDPGWQPATLAGLQVGHRSRESRPVGTARTAATKKSS